MLRRLWYVSLSLWVLAWPLVVATSQTLSGGLIAILLLVASGVLGMLCWAVYAELTGSVRTASYGVEPCSTTPLHFTQLTTPDGWQLLVLPPHPQPPAPIEK